jgi:Tol biopolymer transport system component
MRRPWFILPAAALLVLVASVPAVATFPARNGLIAFTGETDNGTQVFTVRPNGRDMHQITFLEGDAASVDWSPDGRRIAFELIHEFDVDCDIALVDADGGNLQVFDRGQVCDQAPAFFPDGRLLFEGFDPDGGADALWVQNADGTGLHSIGNGPGLATQAEISPDGQRISFFGWNLREEPDKQEGLFTMAADGSGAQLIPSVHDIFPKHDWSPDGRRIAVSTNGEDRTVAANIVTLRPDGSGVFEVTHYVGADERAGLASYSPDGQWILFRLRLGSDRALFRIRPDGTDIHRLTPFSEFTPMDPDWGAAAR